jgi:L-lactate dehydrogenase complex protein LldG
MKNDSREKILNRLQKFHAAGNRKIPEVTADKLIYTEVESDKDNLLERFRITLEQLHGEFYLAKTLINAREILKNLLSDFSDKKCLTHKFKLLNDIITSDTEFKKKIDYKSNLSMPSADFATYEVGITHADYLIARTGSVVITSLSGGGRRLSILPPVHIVLAYQSQLVPSIDNIWENLRSRPLACSSLSIITGPSRTSDIEKELVLGAHGPKRLVVIVVSDNNN